MRFKYLFSFQPHWKRTKTTENVVGNQSLWHCFRLHFQKPPLRPIHNRKRRFQNDAFLKDSGLKPFSKACVFISVFGRFSVISFSHISFVGAWNYSTCKSDPVPSSVTQGHQVKGDSSCVEWARMFSWWVGLELPFCGKKLVHRIVTGSHFSVRK